MPDEAYWDSFFDAEALTKVLHCYPEDKRDVAEFGCGYGTFTLPVAKNITGHIYAFDIESEMIERLTEKHQQASLVNIIAQQRDIGTEGSGLENNSVAHVMIYNLLHIEQSVDFLKEALRILQPGGTLSVIHWNFDPNTPRGPSMEIRPKPKNIMQMAQTVGFKHMDSPDISACAPYHYGLIFIKPENS